MITWLTMDMTGRPLGPAARGKRTIAVLAALLLASACGDPATSGPTGTGGVDSSGGGGDATQPDTTTATDTTTAGDTAGGDGATKEDGLDPADVAGTGDTLVGDTATGEDATVTDTAGGNDTAGGTDSGGGGDSSGGGDTSGGQASEYKGLLIKILGPSGRDWFQNTGQAIVLSGAAFGNPDTITWTDAGGGTGKITPATYWKSSIINLVEGDNHITVTAVKGTKSVSDTIHVVYNPVFQFDGAPDINPRVLFVNESGNMVVHFSASGAAPGADGKSIIDPSTITLVEVDELGKDVAGGVSTTLKDSGQTGDCDDVSKDVVFSECTSIQVNAPKRRYFRVKATVDVGVKKYTAMSPLTSVDVVARFDKGTCNTIVNLQKQVKGDYAAALNAGKSWKDAQADALATLKANAAVAEAGTAEGAGYSVWVRYKTGQLGAVNLAPAEIRGNASAVDSGAVAGSNSVGARRALSLAPNQAEFTAAGGDEADTAGTALKNKQCPPFAVDQASGDQAYLRWYREMSSYGIVAISGHGDVLFGDMDQQAYTDMMWEHHGAQEVIWSGEPVNCGALSSSAASCNQSGGGCPVGETCIKTSLQGGICVDHTQADVMRGRAVIGDTTYGLTPELLRFHMRDNFAASIVYLGACRSMYNGTLALELRAAGAASVIGYSDYVSSKYAAAQGGKFFDNLINAGMSSIAAIPLADVDPKYGGKLRLMGIGESNINNQALINPSWDSGNLTGWKPVGDGRVISRLGVTIPVAGKYMGIISTGLGFTAQSGSLAQPFCVEGGKSELTFYWKFYSEEFKEYCGSAYMDTFLATLTSDIQKSTMVNVYIDSLCDPDCGGKSPCEWGSPSCKCGKDYKGLSQSDVNFDQGGVWMTPWQKMTQDVSALAGSQKKVDLQFFATDKGDSIFDTVILLDEVTVK